MALAACVGSSLSFSYDNMYNGSLQRQDWAFASSQCSQPLARSHMLAAAWTITDDACPRRMKSVISYLRLQWPQTPLVVVGVLPRAGWTMPEDQHAWPNRFSVPMAEVNNATQARSSPL